MGRDHTKTLQNVVPSPPQPQIPNKNLPCKSAYKWVFRSLYVIDVEARSRVTWGDLEAALVNGLGFGVDRKHSGSRVAFVAPPRFGGFVSKFHETHGGDGHVLSDQRQQDISNDLATTFGLNHRKMRRLLRDEGGVGGRAVVGPQPLGSGPLNVML